MAAGSFFDAFYYQAKLDDGQELCVLQTSCSELS